jgi:hypothetical protein
MWVVCSGIELPVLQSWTLGILNSIMGSKKRLHSRNAGGDLFETALFIRARFIRAAH